MKTKIARQELTQEQQAVAWIVQHPTQALQIACKVLASQARQYEVTSFRKSKSSDTIAENR